MHWLLLALAILCEVVATSTLKMSANFSKLIPSLVVIAGYAGAFICMGAAMERLSVSAVYAIWSGAGITLVTIASVFLYKETPDLPAIIGLAFIILGIVIMNLFSKTITH